MHLEARQGRSAGRRPWVGPCAGAAGFTLVELLAVIAIIGLLVGLLLPSVQSARESGRRASCANKIRQIGLGFLQYEAQNGSFPSLVVGHGFCTTGTRPPSTQFLGRPGSLNTSGLVFILPFIEQLSLFGLVDLMQPMCDWNEPFLRTTFGVPTPAAFANHLKVSMTRLDVFECPTASASSRTVGLPTGSTDPVRFYYYGACKGRLTNYQQVFHMGAPYWNKDCDLWRSSQYGTSRPMFGEESFCRGASVTDGLSNVLMIAETNSNGSSDGGSSSGNPWAYLDQAQWGIRVNLGINRWGAIGRPGYTQSQSTPASEHPGGCHFAFGDGAVRFVSENSNASVLQRRVFIADGQNPLDQLP